MYTQLYVPHGWNNWYTLIYIENLLALSNDPSGWKGSVSYGLGADISLPPCLATGIWNLVPKATSGPKSRGASFGTKLWRHVQRYCAQFLVFMLIYGNPALCVFCLCMHSVQESTFLTYSSESMLVHKGLSITIISCCGSYWKWAFWRTETSCVWQRVRTSECKAAKAAK